MSPEAIAARVAIGFNAYLRRFQSITRRAGARFESRDWASLHRDGLDRLDAYAAAVDETIRAITDAGFDTSDRGAWHAARDLFRTEHADVPHRLIAETFFNSVTRRLYTTKGVDADLEFLAATAPTATDRTRPVTRVYERPESVRDLLTDVLRDCRFHASWQDLRSDLSAAVAHFGDTPDRVEVLEHLFYRGKGAYLVGVLEGSKGRTPFALAVRHKSTGLILAAVLIGEEDVAILFSYTRSAFMTQVDDPESLVGFLSEMLPQRKKAELYRSIGFHKHAKTERYRDITGHLRATNDRFIDAPGVPGLVMIVFTLQGYDVVFKVVRDRFPPQKTVTPRQVADKYRAVARHDRAGRLVDAQAFVDLRLPASRFEPDLLMRLTTEASRSVGVEDGQVTFERVYVERRVIPLDIYLRSVEQDEAERAIIDYGAAIKNLAASNIFPGDMLLKNFGVTNRGRVVFYDYDEICPLTECRFRKLPESDDPYDEMGSAPIFGVGPNDVFPEELPRFLGLQPELRAVLMHHHADLFDTAFWTHVQERIASGELIEILPYRRSRSLMVSA